MGRECERGENVDGSTKPRPMKTMANSRAMQRFVCAKTLKKQMFSLQNDFTDFDVWGKGGGGWGGMGGGRGLGLPMGKSMDLVHFPTITTCSLPRPSAIKQ